MTAGGNVWRQSRFFFLFIWRLGRWEHGATPMVRPFGIVACFLETMRKGENKPFPRGNVVSRLYFEYLWFLIPGMNDGV